MDKDIQVETFLSFNQKDVKIGTINMGMLPLPSVLQFMGMSTRGIMYKGINFYPSNNTLTMQNVKRRLRKDTYLVTLIVMFKDEESLGNQIKGLLDSANTLDDLLGNTPNKPTIN